MLDRRVVHGVRASLTCALSVALLIGGACVSDAGDAMPASRNDAYLEVMGNTILGANYARAISDNLSLRVGAGVVPNVGATALLMPILHVGRNARHGVEVGAGVQGLWYEDGQKYPMFSATAGYRFRSRGGFIFRAVGTLCAGKPAGPDLARAGVGVSFGKTF
jgi:hypothetical protein